jgi:hypothetical protein
MNSPPEKRNNIHFNLVENKVQEKQNCLHTIANRRRAGVVIVGHSFLIPHAAKKPSPVSMTPSKTKPKSRSADEPL